MRRAAMWASTLGVFGIGSSAGQDGRTCTQVVDVYLESRVNLSQWLVTAGKAQASRRFAEIGVELRWHKGPLVDLDATPEAIVVTVVEAGPPMRTSDEGLVLANALPYASGGTRITVFYDRVERVIRQYEGRAPVFFGHILAHEIGHILEGVARHSSSGLMRGRWTSADKAEMMRHRLAFSSEDEFLIRNAMLLRRSARAR